MKIGVFVTGHFRKSIPVEENFKWLFDGNDVDFYVATWNEADNRKPFPTDMPHFVPGITTEDVIVNHYGKRLKKYWIGDVELYKKNRPIVFKRNMREDDVFSDANIPKSRALSYDVLFNEETGLIQRIIDQWVIVNQCYGLCEEDIYKSYDVVIRVRPDAVFKTPLPLNISDGIHVGGGDRGYNARFNPDEPDLIPYVIDDRMAWGHPRWMRKYFEFCHYIQIIYDDMNTDISYAEHMIAKYLLKQLYFNTEKMPDMKVTIHDDVSCGLTDGRFF